MFLALADGLLETSFKGSLSLFVLWSVSVSFFICSCQLSQNHLLKLLEQNKIVQKGWKCVSVCGWDGGAGASQVENLQLFA